MQFYKYLIITLMLLALTVPSDGWGRRTLKKIGRGLKKVVKKAEKIIKKKSCKIVYGVVCPAVVDAAGVALSAGTSGAGTAIVAVGVIAGNNQCNVRKKKCKRSVEMDYVMIPFSDEMSDYDMDGDKHVTYHEFVWSVLRSVNLEDPDELLEPFVFADFDENGSLDMDEFTAAPLLFAHSSRQRLDLTEYNNQYV